MNAGSDKQRVLLWLAVPVMAVVLVVLAIVQYRWSGEVSDATRAQMQASLQSSLMGFRMDMARELGAMCLELKAAIPPQGGVDAPRLAAQARHWRETASHPSLLAGVYLAGDTGPLLRLD